MERLWRVCFWGVLVMWAYCLTAHVLTAAGWSPPVLNPLLVGGICVLVLWVGVRPIPRSDLNGNGPWYTAAIVLVSPVFVFWPMVFGSLVPNAVRFQQPFEDKGIPSGPPGDRYISYQYHRVRALTEEEFQRHQKWSNVRDSGISASISGAVFGYALFFRWLRNRPSQPPQQTVVATSISESS